MPRRSRIKFPSLVHMTAEAYHADPCPQPSLSSSIAHTIVSKSPKHAYLAHPRLGGSPKAPTKSMDHGSLVHALLLGKGRDILIVDAPDWRKKETQEERDRARAEGKIPCLFDSFERAKETEKELRSELERFEITLDGVSEMAAFWQETADDGTIVDCRAMFDHWTRARAQALDLKTSRSAHPDACAQSMVEYGYDLQQAAYKSALGKIFPDLVGRIEYLNLFAEVEPPYCVTPASSAGTLRELGESKWRRAINLWAKCVREKQWPGYVSGVVRLEAPLWALKRELEHA